MPAPMELDLIHSIWEHTMKGNTPKWESRTQRIRQSLEIAKSICHRSHTARLTFSFHSETFKSDRDENESIIMSGISDDQNEIREIYDSYQDRDSSDPELPNDLQKRFVDEDGSDNTTTRQFRDVEERLLKSFGDAGSVPSPHPLPGANEAFSSLPRQPSSGEAPGEGGEQKSSLPRPPSPTPSHWSSSSNVSGMDPSTISRILRPQAPTPSRWSSSSNVSETDPMTRSALLAQTSRAESSRPGNTVASPGGDSSERRYSLSRPPSPTPSEKASEKRDNLLAQRERDREREIIMEGTIADEFNNRGQRIEPSTEPSTEPGAKSGLRERVGNVAWKLTPAVWKRKVQLQRQREAQLVQLQKLRDAQRSGEPMTQKVGPIGSSGAVLYLGTTASAALEATQARKAAELAASTSQGLGEVAAPLKAISVEADGSKSEPEDLSTGEGKERTR
jgi:hypothetical protein